MLHSMTGFGRGVRETAHGRLIAEIRALNSRHSEARVRLPGEAMELELRLREQIRATIARGKVDCTLRLEALPDAVPAVNTEALRATFAQLHRAVAGLPLAEGITLEALLRATPREDLSAELWRDEQFQREVESVVAEALAALRAARGAEGGKIAVLLSEQLRQVESNVERVRAAAPKVAEGYGLKLRQRIEELEKSQGLATDPARLEQELILFAQRVDVTEEIDRLNVHCGALRDLFDADEPVGRRMDFLLQEIGREINTIGSKAKDAGITGVVLDLKVIAEQMREQIQNIE